MNHHLEDCPVCRGVGAMQHENGWCVYVTCLDCGAHTAELPYENEEEKARSEAAVAHLWNVGKVIRSTPGE